MRDTERHQRAKALFLELLALPADARVPALEREAADDAELRSEVESLLRHADAPPTGRSLADAARDPGRARFVAGHLFAGRYRIIAELGRGATGEVYRALDTRLNVEIALKIVHGRSPETIRRLLDEVRLARQITNPAICRVYDVEEADGENFLTMELVDGETLASLIARAGRLSASRVREIGTQILDGLAAAHAQGILHRDLKPSNVMIDAGGSVRVTDFGVASYEDRAKTAPFAGTPDFMAPEQLDHGAPASVQTDLYAVGLILYEALVGRIPARDEVTRARKGDSAFPKPSRLFTDVDPALERVVMQLLANNPAQRPRSAAEAAAALAAPNERAAMNADVASRKRGRTGAALVLLGLALLVGYFAVTRWTSSQSALPMWQQVAEIAGRTDDAANVSIAILPLADETETHDQSSLAEGIQREIIERLESIRALRVIADESSDRFGAKANIRNAGRELGVNFVVAGRIKGRTEHPDVELELYDGRTGKPLWRETYEGGTQPLPPEVERRFVTHVSDTLAIDSGAATRTPAAADIDSSTYTLYLRGREHVPPYTEAEFGASVALLRQAIEREPQWAEPYAAIATAYVAACAIGWVEPAEGYPVARRYAERALALDSTLCEAHVANAIVARRVRLGLGGRGGLLPERVRAVSRLCVGSTQPRAVLVDAGSLRRSAQSHGESARARPDVGADGARSRAAFLRCAPVRSCRRTRAHRYPPGPSVSVRAHDAGLRSRRARTLRRSRAGVRTLDDDDGPQCGGAGTPRVCIREVRG